MISPIAAPAPQPSAVPQTPGGVKRYILRQRIFALGQDFHISSNLCLPDGDNRPGLGRWMV
jgi:hypothetical protein